MKKIPNKLDRLLVSALLCTGPWILLLYVWNVLTGESSIVLWLICTIICYAVFARHDSKNEN